jgi:hypothetical protein
MPRHGWKSLECMTLDTLCKQMILMKSDHAHKGKAYIFEITEKIPHLGITTVPQTFQSHDPPLKHPKTPRHCWKCPDVVGSAYNGCLKTLCKQRILMKSPCSQVQAYSCEIAEKIRLLRFNYCEFQPNHDKNECSCNFVNVTKHQIITLIVKVS